ncbi:MAG: site-specific integrase [Azonexus sp.]|jgi:integrase|nr:site-specific integrase [Azonexus sp.]
MSSVQRRGDKFQYRIVAKGVLPKPVFLTFDTKEEGDQYVARLEALIRQGIVPPELVEKNREFLTVGEVIAEYRRLVSIKEDDKTLLDIQLARIGIVQLKSVTYQWCESWIGEMKMVRNMAPSTIRHHVGALARCFDWARNRGVPELAVNPLRLLPKGYSSYTDHDKKTLKKEGKAHKDDVSRDRRLEGDEELRIRAVMNGEKPANRERAFTLPYQAATECVFELALESAMRMREIYTLEVAQVDFGKRTIFLERTKNGSKRQVPMSSVAIKAIKVYMECVKSGSRNMTGFSFESGRLFPWWNGNLDPKTLRAVTTTLSQQYARIFSAAGADDFNFHDLRHEATSRLFERTSLSESEIMKITGHSSIKMLLRYANLRGSNLADKLW